MLLLWSQDKYIEAYFYAAQALNYKKFPGTDLPYMVHVSLVSMEVMAALQAELGLDNDLAVQCALLHDIIEDGCKKFEELSAEFGDRVAKGVQALSKNRNLTPNQQMQDCISRIKEQPREIWMVKMADRITNLLPPPRHWTSSRIKDYFEESKDIYEALKPASKFLADRLSDKIEDYQKFISW